MRDLRDSVAATICGREPGVTTYEVRRLVRAGSVCAQSRAGRWLMPVLELVMRRLPQPLGRRAQLRPSSRCCRVIDRGCRRRSASTFSQGEASGGTAGGDRQAQ